MIAYHASNKKFDKFSIEQANTGKHKENFNALWFSTDKDYIKQFGKIIYKVDIDTKNFLKESQYRKIDNLVKEFDSECYDGIGLLETERGQEFADFLVSKGIDGYIFPQNDGKTIICFNPNVVKIIDTLNETTEKLIPCIIQCRELDGYNSFNTLEYEGIVRDKVKYKSQKDMELNWRPKRKSDLTVWNFLVYHKPNSTKIIDKDNNLDGWDIKYLPTESMNEAKAYHGTRANFDKFDLSKFQRGDYGYGIYFTRSKSYASDFGSVKEYEIPDTEYLLSWEDTWQYQSEYVYNCLDNLFDDLYDNDRDAWEKIINIVDRGYGNDGEGLYMNLSEILKLSSKQTSELLYKYGIKGIDSFKGNCQVIFNPDDINLSINEKVEELEQGIYATQSAYDILNWLKNKPAPYRVVYDKNIRMYFICNAYDYIHQDMLEAAYRSGFYPEMYSQGEVRDYIDDCIFNGELLFFAFSPDADRVLDKEKSSDGYTQKYTYDFGAIYSHEMTPLEDFDFYQLVGKPIKKDFIYEDFKSLNEKLQEFLS